MQPLLPDSIVFATLPFISLFLLALITHHLLAKYGLNYDWRQTTLLATGGWGMWLVLITEIPSYLQSLRFYSLVAGWMLLILPLVWLIYRMPPRIDKFKIPKFATSTKLLLGGITFIAVTTGLVGLLSPPNNWDSMTYHLARAAYYIQHGNLDYYDANF